MRFKIERVRYSDGGKSPWWRLVAYKHGFRYGESPQFSSLFYVMRMYIKLTILYCLA